MAFTQFTVALVGEGENLGQKTLAQAFGKPVIETRADSRGDFDRL